MMFFLNPRIHKALYYATTKHESQFRKGTRKHYVVHPIAVSGILYELMNKYNAIDEHLFVAALLHDCLEDTDATAEDIEAQFGGDVLNLIQKASEPDKSLSWQDRKAETIAKISTMDLRELLVPLADKIHNLSEVDQDLCQEPNDSLYWSKYNAGATDQKWYHGSLIEEMNKRIMFEKDSDSPFIEMVSDLVKIYEGLFLNVFK